jgi:hypothetical protein
MSERSSSDVVPNANLPLNPVTLPPPAFQDNFFLVRDAFSIGDVLANTWRFMRLGESTYSVVTAY